MRHRGRTHLARLHLLLEIAEGNIAPHIAVEINQNSIDAGNGLEKLRHIIVRLDLNRVRIERQPQILLDKTAAMPLPIHIGIRNHMGIVIAHRAIDFAQKFLSGKLLRLTFQTIQHIGDLLAQSRRRGRLPVRTAHHRHRRQLMRQRAQLIRHLGQLRQQNLIARLAQHQSVRQIIDVLAGAGKMDELRHRRHRRHTGKPLLQPILDSLHIMIGRRLDGLHRRRVVQRKTGNHIIDFGQHRLVKRRHLHDFRLGGQRLQPRQLHPDPGPHQAVFGKNGAQGLDGFRITPVQRRQSGNRIDHVRIPVQNDRKARLYFKPPHKHPQRPSENHPSPLSDGLKPPKCRTMAFHQQRRYNAPFLHHPYPT